VGVGDANGFSGWCTGQLIDCRHVLTAQHCLRSASDTHFHVGFLRYAPAHAFETVLVPIQIGNNVFVRQPGVYNNAAAGPDDLMVIRLPTSAPMGFTRLAYYEGPLSPVPGPDATVVGYGKISGSTLDPNNRRFGTLFSANVSLAIFNQKQIYEWLRSDDREVSGLEGDSGGPLLLLENGRWRTGGVLSQFYIPIHNDWSTLNRWAMVSTHRAWLDGITGTPEIDSDGDGQPDSCDNCPNYPNPSQKDSDGDLLGDPCDKCPFDADNDLDGDGVCADKDNCPAVSNADQLNSNLLSEKFHTPGDERGDKCEPVPVPAGRALANSTTNLIQISSGGCGAFDFCQRIWNSESNRIATRAVRSNQTLSNWKKVNGVVTASRFCPKPLLQNDPPCDNQFAIDDDRLDDALSAAVETRAQPYHRITVTGETRGQTRKYNYTFVDGNSASPYSYIWDYVADRQFWEANNKAPVPPNDWGTNPISGLFWQHAYTDVGGTVDVGTGLHGQQLANSHFDAAASKNHQQKSAPYVGPNDWEWWLWPMSTSLPGVVDAVFQHVPVIIPHENTVSYLASNNWVFEVSSQFGAAAKAAMLTTATRWVSQAEPQSLRADFSTIVGLVVNRDGTQITERLSLSEDGQRVLGAADLDPRALPVHIQSTPFTSFQVVFARSLGQVYELSDGQIWSGPPEGPFARDAVTGPIGTVLAATYEPRSRALFSLRHDGVLVRMDLFARTASTVGTVPGLASWERKYLVADRDGSVLVVLANDTSYDIWRLSPSFNLTRVRQSATRGLAVPPVVELTEYLLVERTGRDQVALTRVATL
jgi:hypothetical protein